MIKLKGRLKNFLDSFWARFMLALFGLGLVFAIWAIISSCTDATIFPGPNIVIPHTFELLGQASTWEAIGGTLFRMLFALLLSFMVAFILGLIAGLHPTFRTFLKPTILVCKTIPPAAIIFAMFVYVKSYITLFTVIFLMMFPILYEAVADGVENVNKDVINALKIDVNINKPKAIFKVIVPAASPYILLGLVQTLGLGMKVSIMAETLVGWTDIPGIGVNIRLAYIDYVNAEAIFSNAIFAIIIIASLDVLLSFLKKRIKANL